MSVGHMMSLEVEERYTSLSLITAMINDVKKLFNPLVPIQEKVSICKTWRFFVYKARGSTEKLDLSELDEIDEKKIIAVVDEIMTYIIDQMMYKQMINIR